MKNRKNKKNISKYLIIILIIAIILILGLLFYTKKENNVSIFKLYGDEYITIYDDDIFDDPGFLCIDKDGNDISEFVVVDDSDFSHSVGEHTISYSITLGVKKVQLVRKINVLNNPFKEYKFSINEPSILNLERNSYYSEPGFLCIDNTGKDITDSIKVDSNLDINNVGEYTIKYTLSDGENSKTLERKVNVLNELFSLDYDIEPTNEDIDINFISNIKNCKYIIGPNNKKIDGNIITYRVSENGIYTFTVYDTSDYTYEHGVEINNIDKEIKATCTLEQYRSTSKVIVNGEDDIEKVIYGGKIYYDTTIDVQNRVGDARIYVYDKAKNNKEITCNVVEKEKIFEDYIIIGDSRTVIMDMYISDAKTKKSNTHIIAKSSMGYNWMVSNAIPEVNKILKANPNKGFYILSNFGVNDPGNINKYITKYNELVEGEWKDHKVGFISLYPYSNGNENSSQNKSIKNFNSKVKAGISPKISYCDVYNGLGYKGFTATDSGLHHNRATSLNIYKYILEKC